MIDPSMLRALDLALVHFDDAYVNVVQAARRVLILVEQEQANKASVAPPAQVSPPTAPRHVAATKETARALGYTGDSCRACGSFAMQRSGTCIVCANCGASAGCS